MVKWLSEENDGEENIHSTKTSEKLDEQQTMTNSSKKIQQTETDRKM